MRKSSAKRVTRFIVTTALVIAFISVLATTLPAQRRRLRPPRESDTAEIEARQRETLERSAALERAGTEASSPSVDPQISARRHRMFLLRQIREDFEGLQDLHDEMMKTAAADYALNYKRISETTAKIKKHASRLKTNLAFPEPEERKESRRRQSLLDGDQVKTSVFVISDLITGFLKNPLFQNSGIIDAQLSVQANRDLVRIIELSGTIKKSAEKLQKTSKQSN